MPVKALSLNLKNCKILPKGTDKRFQVVMNKPKYLFISRKSSHYRYYQKLVSFLGSEAELQVIKRFALPTLKYKTEVNKLDINDLVDVHLKRKLVRHPVLAQFGWVQKFIKFIYVMREKARAAYYFDLFNNHAFETLVIWNGMKQPNRTPYMVAKACGKKTMLFENGLLPNTTTLDPIGVNAFNSMPSSPEFYLEWSGNLEVSENTLVVRAPHKNRKIDKLVKALPERFVFVPFQVPNDTQVICHSPWVSSMTEFYEVLEKSLVQLKKESDWKPFKIVIKEHPSWPRNFSELHNKNEDIIFANGDSTQDLIEKSIAVVTLNSTVGIESLMLKKKVITLGNAFFNIEGLVQQCKSQNELQQKLLMIDDAPLNERLIEQFLGYLQHEYLLPQSWDRLTDPEAHFQSVKKRLSSF